MKLYGKTGFYHHRWARVLTLMSPQGVTATLAYLESTPGVEIKHDEGALPKLVELEKGSLSRAKKTLQIEVLSAEEWAHKKAELGEQIWR